MLRLLAPVAALVVLPLPACTSAPEAAPEPACFIDYEPEPEPAPLYPEPAECDPRISAERSPRLQPPVLIGEHEDGTIYAVDRLDNGFHWIEAIEGQDLSPRVSG